MNFGMLKNMVENIVSTYKCPFCGSREITEKHIDIVGAAGNTVNIDMLCPSCNKHFMAKTEIMNIDIGNVSPEKLEKIQQSIAAIRGKLGGNIEVQSQKHRKNDESAIQDESIVEMQKTMKKKDFSAQDLFGQE